MKQLCAIGRGVIFSFGLSLLLRAEVPVALESNAPSRIRSDLVIFSADWVSHLPPSARVNAPDVTKALFPGQKIALALVAEGAKRDGLLSEVQIDLRISTPTQGVSELRKVKPVAIKQIKAQGADMAMIAMNAGGFAPKDRADLEGKTAFVSFGVFQPDWTAPLVDQEEEIEISAKIVGASSGIKLDPIRIKIRPLSAWLNDPAPSNEEMGSFLTRYHDDLSAGRLLYLLKASAENQTLKIPSMVSFFASAYRTNELARAAAVAAFPTLDAKTQFALMYVLQLGGQDVGRLLPATPADTLAKLATIEPLKDPRALLGFHESVTPEAVSENGVHMDQCWSGWMATGDQSYLRALVGLLGGAGDYPALQAWTKARGGVKGLNTHVARGLAYQIAGWSIGSFQRTDPLVSDWLIFWANDASIPASIRKEIELLPGNPAFRRN